MISLAKKLSMILFENSRTVLQPSEVPYFLFLFMLNYFIAVGETY